MDLEQILQHARHWLESGAWVSTGRRLVIAAAIFIAALLLAQLIHLGLDRMRKRAMVASPVIYVVEKISGYLIILVGLILAVSTLGVDLRSLTVFAGALGVGVGLGLQGIVKEFVSGLVLIFDPSIQVGDFVELDNDIRGEVVEIGPRASRLRTNDDLNVVIPNSTLMQSQVINWTYNAASRRIHVPFSVAERADKALVRQVVLAAARALPFTLPDTELRKTQVWLTGFGSDGLDFDLVVWPTLDSTRHPRTMHSAYTWAIHEALQGAGIDNSTPQMELEMTSLFGRRDEDALRTLNLVRPEETHDRMARPAPAPNDAAAAVYDDEDRNRLQRDDEPRKRNRPPR